jgi:adenosylcobyric acid synthase
MGETTRDGAPPLLEVDGRAEGCAGPDGRVWGTYLHGLSEGGAARRHVLAWARGAVGSGPAPSPAADPPDHRARREVAYDRLADALAACLDARARRELGLA